VGQLDRQVKTLFLMVRLYCQRHHHFGTSLCPACQELYDYANMRLQKCRFQPHKPPCSKCATSCYNPNMRRRMRAVMKYAGPRMLLTHPILAIEHLLGHFRVKKQ
jgi:predicted amidophosphoribosyltransferase